MNLIVDIAIFCDNCNTELSRNKIETGISIYVEPCPNCCKEEGVEGKVKMPQMI